VGQAHPHRRADDIPQTRPTHFEEKAMSEPVEIKATIDTDVNNAVDRVCRT
jgi:hypothetical protein